MVKRLRKVANSNARLLERPIMDLLGLAENAEVELTVHNGPLLVTPVNPRPVGAERFEECVRKVLTARHETLRRLAR